MSLCLKLLPFVPNEHTSDVCLSREGIGMPVPTMSKHVISHKFVFSVFLPTRVDLESISKFHPCFLLLFCLTVLVVGKNPEQVSCFSRSNLAAFTVCKSCPPCRHGRFSSFHLSSHAMALTLTAHLELPMDRPSDKRTFDDVMLTASRGAATYQR